MCRSPHLPSTRTPPLSLHQQIRHHRLMCGSVAPQCPPGRPTDKCGHECDHGHASLRNGSMRSYCGHVQKCNCVRTVTLMTRHAHQAISDDMKYGADISGLYDIGHILPIGIAVSFIHMPMGSTTGSSDNNLRSQTRFCSPSVAPEPRLWPTAA